MPRGAYSPASAGRFAKRKRTAARKNPLTPQYRQRLTRLLTRYEKTKSRSRAQVPRSTPSGGSRYLPSTPSGFRKRLTEWSKGR